jgi:hypothetical protein
MNPQVCKNHNLGEIENFQNTFLGVPNLCATLMQPTMLVTKYIIGEEVDSSPCPSCDTLCEFGSFTLRSFFFVFIGYYLHSKGIVLLPIYKFKKSLQRGLIYE